MEDTPDLRKKKFTSKMQIAVERVMCRSHVKDLPGFGYPQCICTKEHNQIRSTEGRSWKAACTQLGKCSHPTLAQKRGWVPLKIYYGGNYLLTQKKLILNPVNALHSKTCGLLVENLGCLYIWSSIIVCDFVRIFFDEVIHIIQ